MSTRRDKERVEEVVVAVERLVAGGELDRDAVLARPRGLGRDNEVIFDVNGNNRRVPDPDATDPLLWSRKI